MEKIEKFIKKLLKDKYHILMSETYFCLFNATQMGSGARFTGVDKIQHFFDNGLLTDDLDTYLKYLDKARHDNSGLLLGIISKVGDMYFMTNPSIQISPASVKFLRSVDKPYVLRRFTPDYYPDIHETDVLVLIKKTKLKTYINELK